MTDVRSLQSKLWKYRGRNLEVSTVVTHLGKLSPVPFTEEHGRFIGLYLSAGPEGYRKQHDKYSDYKEYRLISVLMARFLLSLKAIRGVAEGEEKTDT